MNPTTGYTRCACCNERLDTFEQRVLRVHIMVTCNNTNCRMYGFTYCPVEHEHHATSANFLNRRAG